MESNQPKEETTEQPEVVETSKVEEIVENERNC